MTQTIVRIAHAVAAAGLIASMFVVTRADSQQPPAAPRPESFPAQQRPPGDPAVVARGKTLYEATCAFCHGKDLRGGEMNGPNLLRSLVVLSDKAGEQIMPIV